MSKFSYHTQRHQESKDIENLEVTNRIFLKYAYVHCALRNADGYFHLMPHEKCVLKKLPDTKPSVPHRKLARSIIFNEDSSLFCSITVLPDLVNGVSRFRSRQPTLTHTLVCARVCAWARVITKRTIHDAHICGHFTCSELSRFTFTFYARFRLTLVLDVRLDGCECALYVRTCMLSHTCEYLYTYTRWASHKLISLSRVARLLLAPRIARLHNSGGRSARFSSTHELFTFPGLASLQHDGEPCKAGKGLRFAKEFQSAFPEEVTCRAGGNVHRRARCLSSGHFIDNAAYIAGISILHLTPYANNGRKMFGTCNCICRKKWLV